MIFANPNRTHCNMKTKILFSLTLLGMSLASFAQTPAMSGGPVPTPAMKQPQAQTQPDNPNAPEIFFSNDSHDFGTIDQGGNGTTEFSFKNTGKEPLIIQDAKGSCGCTVPSFPKEPIKPGATGTIKVTYDTKRVGAFSKTVTITSNAKSGNKLLTIKGNVKATSDEDTFPAKKVSSGTPVEGK